MAGFGIFMAFLQFGVVGLVLATIAAILLRFWGERYIPIDKDAFLRRSFLRATGWAPFVGVLWILLVFIAYSYTNDWFLHRDDGMSTNPHAPLPNGYIIGSVDYHSGYIVMPGHQINDHPRQSGDDRISDVLYIDVTKDYILGNQYVFDSPSNNAYFIWDLRANNQLYFASLDEFRAAAAQRGMRVANIPNERWSAKNSSDNAQGITRVDLVSYWDFYQKYRRTWFDYFAVALMIAGQFAILALLVRRGRAIKALASPETGI